MKIGLDTAPKTFPETYSQHLASLLARYAPEYEYILDAKGYDKFDIYHGFRSPVPLSVRLRGIRSVVTVSDLNFLRYPQMYSFFDRVVTIRRFKGACRRADCVITLNRRAKEELAECLSIDERKIKVMMQLAAHPPFKGVAGADYGALRRKYALPEEFVLMIGIVEARHNQLEVLEAMLEDGVDTGLVICGRRTTYSDFLLKFARAVGDAMQVEFLYEPEPVDLPALFRMARAFVYIPDAQAEASVLPVVEALRAGTPMVLSDTPLHREVAADAAVYVPEGADDRLAGALRCVLNDEEFRRELAARQRARAEIFSECAVARRLVDLYSSL